MKNKISAPFIGALALIVILLLAGCAPAARGADPQKLLIPRWFLSELTVDGEKVEIPAGQQDVTIQFEEAGKANGTGGCNSFGTDYKAGTDGKLTFGPITATLMACDAKTQIESAYFQALGKVQRFSIAEGKLILSSDDGKTVLVFNMPPK